jgi:hypothetical protein
MIFVYILSILIILLENSLFGVYFYFQCVVWDPLSIVVILVALYSSNVKSVYKYTVLISLLQDIFSFSYGVNLLSKLVLATIAVYYRKNFFVSSFFIKSLIVILLSGIDVGFKILSKFLFLQHFELCLAYIFYILLNFAVFYIYYLLKEKELNTNIE